MQKEAPIINAWLAHYNHKHGLHYQISEFPDETNRNSAEVDAIARDGEQPPLAIEETIMINDSEPLLKPLLHKKSRLLDYRKQGFRSVLLISIAMDLADVSPLTHRFSQHLNNATHLDVIYLSVQQVNDKQHQCLKDLCS